MGNLREKFIATLKDLRKDDEGAALIEYTVLVGLITVAVITLVTTVGTWVSGQWTTLDTNLNG